MDVKSVPGRVFALCGIALCLASVSSSALAQDAPVPQPVREIGNAIRGVFNFLGDLAHPKVAELEALVEGGKYGEAADYYLANEMEFSGSAGANAQLQRIVAALNASFSTEARAIGAQLAVLRAEVVAEWPQARTLLIAARNYLDRYDAVPLLKRPEHRATSIVELAQALAATQARLAAGTPTSFAEYNHAASPLFFDAYPMEIPRGEREAIVRAGAAVWLNALARSSESHAKVLVRAYGDTLPTGQRPMLATAYREMLIRTRSLTVPLSANDALKLARALQEEGLREGMIGIGLRLIVLQETAGPSIEWQADVLGLPVAHVPLRDLPAFLRESAATKSGEVFVIVDPHRVFVHHGTTNVTTLNGRRLTGYRTEANPQWEQARMAVDAARQTLGDVQRQNDENQRQAQQLARQSGGSSFYMLGAMAGSGLSTYAVNAAQQELRDAEARFRSTPQTMHVPQYVDYVLPVATIQALKRHEVGVYVLEVSTGRFWRTALREQASESGEFRLNAHPQDPDRARTEADNQSGQNRLASFLKGPAPLTASDMWDRLATEAIRADQPADRLVGVIQADLRAWDREVAEELARRDAASKAAQAQMGRLSRM